MIEIYLLFIAGILVASAADQVNNSTSTNRPDRWARSIEKTGVPNLHQISDTLYRSAQPSAEGMRELKKMGVKTIVNLRSFHSDRDEIGETGLQYEHIYMKAFHPEDKELVRFLQIVTDTNRAPVLVHCQHGADRTGTMCALYRIAVCGWSKEEAIKEMREGGFGFHEIWQNLIPYIQNLDITAIRARAGLSPLAEPALTVKTNTYHSADGTPHLYLAQESYGSYSNTPVLVYLHGAGGREEQGMTLFKSLRNILHTNGWVYVCPRDYEYDGLYQDLVTRYGRRPLILSGASAGGREAYQEAIAHSERYSALILLCPAVIESMIRAQDVKKLNMPFYVICGTKDPIAAPACQALDSMARGASKRVHYRELPNGDHGAPLKEINWPEALRFIREKN